MAIYRIQLIMHLNSWISFWVQLKLNQEQQTLIITGLSKVGEIFKVQFFPPKNKQNNKKQENFKFENWVYFSTISIYFSFNDFDCHQTLFLIIISFFFLLLQSRLQKILKPNSMICKPKNSCFRKNYKKLKIFLKGAKIGNVVLDYSVHVYHYSFLI